MFPRGEKVSRLDDAIDNHRQAWSPFLQIQFFERQSSDTCS